MAYQFMDMLNPPVLIEVLVNGHSIGCVCPPATQSVSLDKIPHIEEINLIEVAFDGDVVLALDQGGKVLIDRLGNFHQNHPFYLFSKESEFSFYHPALQLIWDWEAQATIRYQLHQWKNRLDKSEPDF